MHNMAAAAALVAAQLMVGLAGKVEPPGVLDLSGS
jgi:hypothetical protein